MIVLLWVYLNNLLGTLISYNLAYYVLVTPGNTFTIPSTALILLPLEDVTRTSYIYRPALKFAVVAADIVIVT